MDINGKKESMLMTNTHAGRTGCLPYSVTVVHFEVNIPLAHQIFPLHLLGCDGVN